MSIDSMGRFTAISILQKHFGRVDSAKDGKADGLLTRQELQAVYRDPKAPSDVREAARTALQFDFFAELDTAQNGGVADGKIGLGDLEAYASVLCPTMSEHEVMKSVVQCWGLLNVAGGQESDGVITPEDLRAGLNQTDATGLPRFSTQDRSCFLTLLSNKALFDRIDTADGSAADGKITWSAMRKFAPRES